MLVLLFSPKHRGSVRSVQVCEVAGEPRSPLHHVNHSGHWEVFCFGYHLGLSRTSGSTAQCLVWKIKVCHQIRSAILYFHRLRDEIYRGIFETYSL